MAKEEIMEPNDVAIELIRKIETSKYAVFVMTSYLVGDRKKPSKDRTRRRAEVFQLFKQAYKVETIEEVLETDGDIKVSLLRKSMIGLSLTRTARKALIDFINEALDAYDLDENKVEVARLNGQQQDQLLILLDSLSD